ncbi:TetR/AcrR family transcriptional regulator [Chitiniphilus purpureus]|uniref:TetR/AcrR family transcriptional regulator n=1 Tax=Chitiniphilus purpureus TaxID=2981137 RepID=A0ABY6DU05_9NEIS|nr:TetR/AcrR family transcriptional regulator [Chitiniphilus sp. CD1]UXY17213.1 TetR/AcrR family transcriptional regulator [Chitiniphilus sp. CD1]
MLHPDPHDLTALPARQRILLTAHALFYRDGIRATGIDRVIAQAQVTKVTFYRHFPSKDDLVLAFLAHRHALWLSWFDAALTREGDTLDALPTVLAQWFAEPVFRGCAFLNSVGELGEALPEVRAVTHRHKQDMVAVLERLLPPGEARHRQAQALAVALDGAIVHATFDPQPETALDALRILIQALRGPDHGDTARSR